MIYFQFADTFKEANGSVKSLDSKPDSNVSQAATVQNGTISSTKPVHRSSSMNSNSSTGNQDVSVCLSFPYYNLTNFRSNERVLNGVVVQLKS